ncbi:MAG: ABC transporter substrate-binding protein [Oscillospiraceae bacterium]|jgi:peptide/nickel transport system substrate-binding protein|nr:ABC transporter substrate-binding protein [Oscillospiraceae bacterium]
MCLRCAAVALLAALLVSCSEQWGPAAPDLVVEPVPVEAPVPENREVLIPSGAARSVGFGLAWVRAERLEPFAGNRAVNAALLPLIYEGLYAIGKDFEPVPLLCASMTYAGDNVYVVEPSPFALFSDGSPLTAADVAYSLKEAAKPGSVYAALLMHITSAEADGSAVKVTLSRPVTRFAACLTFPVVKAGEPYIGTGRYVFESAGAGGATLTRNALWHGDGSNLPGRIDLLDCTDMTSVSFYFQYGHIALLSSDFTARAEPVIRSGCERRDYPSPLMEYIELNAAKTLPDAQNLKKVFALALDRAALCEKAYEGNADPCAEPLPPSSPEARPYESGYSRREAALLLTCMGAEDADHDGVLELPMQRGAKTPLRFVIIVNSENAAQPRAARMYAEELRALGMDVTVNALPGNEYSRAYEAGEYDICFSQRELPPDFSFDLAPGVGNGDVLIIGFVRKSLLMQRGLAENASPAPYDMFAGFERWGFIGV